MNHSILVALQTIGLYHEPRAGMVEFRPAGVRVGQRVVYLPGRAPR